MVATDGRNRSTSVELAVTMVTITNVKNQPPRCASDSYSVVVPENTARDTPIVVRGTPSGWVGYRGGILNIIVVTL